MQKYPSIRRSMLTGTIWMVAARLAVRSLGLVSTIVLARLLAPRDFGLIAMTSAFVGLMETIFSQGIDTALIQNPNATTAHWHSAWTVRILQGALMGLLLLVITPFAVRFYHQPEVAAIMPCLALSSVIASFENIGTVAFRKELEFHRDFMLSLAKKVLQFAVAISAGFLLRDYWALVAGIVASAVGGTLLSYWMHPFRPRLNLEKAREIWSFSKRMSLFNFLNYVNVFGERAVIGGLTDARNTGLFTVGDELADLPTTEMIMPIFRAIVPGLAKVSGDIERLKAAFNEVLGAVALLNLPAGIGIAIVAPQLVELVLGPKWTGAVPVVQILGIAGAARGVRSAYSNLMVVLGKLKPLVRVTAVLTTCFVALLAPAVHRYGIIGAADLKAVITFAGIIALGLLAHRAAAIPLIDAASVLWRPTIGVAIMALACRPVQSLISGPAACLACTAVTGAAAYIATVYVLWTTCGRPRGAEQQLLAIAGTRLKPSM